MIELAFGESTAGALKIAKSMKQGEQLSGTTAVIGGTEKEQRSERMSCIWSGMTMEGSSKDVEALTLALDIGDISDMDSGMNARKRVLGDLFEGFPGVSDNIWETNQHALKRINEARSTLEHIRMWICSSDPVEMCGFYFVCHLMADAQTPLSVVRIPTQIEKDNIIVFYRSTGEIPPEKLGALTKYEELIGQWQRRAYSNIWTDLVNENAPLRSIINGSVIGVPADFYDFALRANMPDGEIMVARLIGKTLSQIPGVGDRWLFLRMQDMIKSGELIEVSAAAGDHPYSGVVKRDSEIERK